MPGSFFLRPVVMGAYFSVDISKYLSIMVLSSSGRGLIKGKGFKRIGPPTSSFLDLINWLSFDSRGIYIGGKDCFIFSPWGV